MRNRFRRLPAIALPQPHNMRHVMASVPSIKSGVLIQPHQAQFRMAEGPFPFGIR